MAVDARDTEAGKAAGFGYVEVADVHELLEVGLVAHGLVVLVGLDRTVGGLSLIHI